MDEKPEIIINDIVFTEPTTFLTDLLVAVLCIIFAIKLFDGQKASARQNFRVLFFLMTGISALAGGIYHLLSLYLGENLAYSSWIVSSLGVFMLEMWSLSFLQNKRRLIFLSITASGLFVGSFAAILIMKSFLPVVLRSAAGVFAIVVPARLQTKNDMPDFIFKNFFYAIGFSILSAIAYIPVLSIHKWFNNADMGHVLLAVSVYFFYRAASTEKQEAF